MLSTVIVVLLVILFIVTFVVPIAKKSSVHEGFALYSTDAQIQAQTSQYVAERKRMTNEGNQVYNRLGSSVDPRLPTFAVLNTDINTNKNLTDSQYVNLFNKANDKTNKAIVSALATFDMVPTPRTQTKLGPSPVEVRDKLPPSNDLMLKARKCETKLRGRNSCAMLDNPEYSACGVCIDAGTQYDGSNADSFIGGLLSLRADRSDATSAANGGIPSYYPSLGKCPPGMFYVDSDSCNKAVNRLNCKEIGDSGGFQGGKSREGKTAETASCAQAPIAGANTYLFQPPNKPYNVILRFLTPFGSGITKVLVTHKPSGNTYTADNGGRAGVEFTIRLPNVLEADAVDILVAQEVPHRPKGKAEVFFINELGGNGKPRTYDQAAASDLCTRIGAKLASSTQVRSANNSGLQSHHCGMVNDSTSAMYSVQSGTDKFIGVGSRPSADFCPGMDRGDKNYEPLGAWCYGFKPAASTNVDYIKTNVVNFFQSFAAKAQPTQGPGVYSQFSSPDSFNPPGISERAILVQWEMEDSTNRTVPFQATIKKVNDYPAGNVLRMLGPFSKSSLIAGPAWSPQATMQKNQFWLWSKSAKSQTVTFSTQVPGYLENPYYSDDVAVAPLGPLITNPATMDLLKTSPCFEEGQTAGKYSSACLLTLFKGAGGDPSKGTLATQKGGLAQLNAMGDLSDISDYLDGLYLAATSGKDSNGDPLSLDMGARIAAMNDAALKLFGFEISNPCEDIVDNPDGSVGLMPKAMAQVTPSCLQYLWLNNLSDADRSNKTPAPNSLFSNTYTSITDRFSGLRYNESTPKRRSQYPFQPCTTKGSMAPIKDGKPDMPVVNQLSGMASLQAVQNFFNNIHKSANFTKGPQDSSAQATAMQQCYGVSQAPNKNLKGAGCPDIIPPPDVKPGITCYINLGDTATNVSYLTYSNNNTFFGGNNGSPNAKFYLTAPLNGQTGCVTFMTLDPSPLVLRHAGFRIWAHPYDSSGIFAQDSSWLVIPALNKNPNLVSFQSVNFPDHYFSQSGGTNEVWSTTYNGSPNDADMKSFAILGPLPDAPAVTSPMPPLPDGLSNYTLYAGKDAAGSDISCFGVNGLSDVLDACESNPKCVGFITATTPQNKITLGCTKYAINQDGLTRDYPANSTFKKVDSYVKNQPPPPPAPSGPRDCQTLGRSDGRMRVYTQGECNTLNGNLYGGGECIRPEGGSFSWDCRYLNGPGNYGQ